MPHHTKKIAGTGRPCPANKTVRQAFWEACSAFLAAFREAAEKLKAGDRSAKFPGGSFTPGLPFVSAYPAMPP